MNYSALTFFSYELLTITLNPIKLLSYDTFLPSINQTNSQRREKFFSIFAPTLGG